MVHAVLSQSLHFVLGQNARGVKGLTSVASSRNFLFCLFLSVMFPVQNWELCCDGEGEDVTRRSVGLSVCLSVRNDISETTGSIFTKLGTKGQGNMGKHQISSNFK